MAETLPVSPAARTSEAERTLAVLCVVGAMVCFAIVPVFLRHLRLYLDKWTVNAARYSVAALFWLPFVLRLDRQRRAGGQPAGRNVWVAALVPAAVNFVGQVGWGASAYYVEATTISFLIRTSFLFTMLLGFVLIPEERLLARKPAFYLGALVCVGGAAIMFLQELRSDSHTSLIGVIIVLTTAVFWGGYAVSVRRFLRGFAVRLSFGVISLYTAGALVVLAAAMRLVGPGPYPALSSVSAPTWGLLVGSAFVGIAFAHIMYYRGIHRLGPVVANGIMVATPFVTYVGAAIFLGEQLTALQWAGGLAVLGGGLLLVVARGQVDAAAYECIAFPLMATGREEPLGRRR